MKPYNAPFFGLFQNLFLVSKQKFGETVAMSLFTDVMEKGLKAAYGENFVKGDTQSFVEAVGERDKDVGLDVKFRDVTKESLTYEFHTDPFPLLRGQVVPQALDAAYMNFKVRHLLGSEWKYDTRKHLWKGDDCTQHVITKNKPKV